MSVRKILKGLLMAARWCYVQVFAWRFYDKRYLQGRWFADGIKSLGWMWAARDIHYRIHTFKHLEIRWPIAPEIESGDNVVFDPDDLNNMNGFGNYYQTIDGRIVLGKGCYIAPNVGLITTNHNPVDLEDHLEGKDIILGKECWVGMNSVILPGVILGDHTIVGAGSVVTKCFEEGHCIIAGNPARKIRELTSNKV